MNLKSALFENRTKKSSLDLVTWTWMKQTWPDNLNILEEYGDNAKRTIFSVLPHSTLHMDTIMIHLLKNITRFQLRGLTSSMCECISVWERQRVRDKRPVVAPGWEDGLLWPHWSKSLTGSPFQSIQREVGNSAAAVWTTSPAISALSLSLYLFLTYTVFTPPT